VYTGNRIKSSNLFFTATFNKPLIFLENQGLFVSARRLSDPIGTEGWYRCTS